MMIAPADAIVAGRRHDEVDVAGDRPARLAQQEPADVVVITFEGKLLAHHRVTGRRKYPARDHITLLALGVAADDRDDPLGDHSIPPAIFPVTVQWLWPSAAFNPSRSFEPKTTLLFVAT